MDLARGYRAKGKFELKGVGIGLNSDPFLIIKLLDSRVLRIISRSLFLSMVIVALPFIGFIVRDSSGALYDDAKFESSDLFGIRSMPLVFEHLIDEGLLKKGHKGLFLSSSIGGLDENLRVLNDHGIDLVVDSFLDHQSSIPDKAFDFVYAPSFQGVNLINRVLKMDGIMIMPLSNDPLNKFKQDENFKIVYICRYGLMLVAMRKLNLAGGFENSQTTRSLCGITVAARKGALKGLEDLLLEPPRRALAKSNNRKIKFLPNLLEDSLETYINRRVFITDGESGVVDWFYKNYPTRNQYFEIQNVELEIDDKEKASPWATGISDWLRKNVKKEDYVVMKAEAAIVEKMIMEKTLCLVDELFLECKNQWEDDGEKIKSKRAYWQCLELYGRLRDEGVAVQQWWSP